MTFSDDGPSSSPGGPAGTFMAGAIVSKDGRYRIDHVLAGQYTLQACGFGLVSKANGW